MSGRKPYRTGRKGMLSTEAYKFDFEPSYSDDRSTLFFDHVLGERAFAALRLARALGIFVDGRTLLDVNIEGSGFDEALDGLIARSLGEAGWWGKGVAVAEGRQSRAAVPAGDGAGTGFFISGDGLAVTAAHVVNQCKAVEARAGARCACWPPTRAPILRS